MTTSIDYSKLILNNPRSFEFMEPFLGEYLQTLRVNERYRVLDIGCFQGSNILPFIELGAEKLYGVDTARIPVEIFSNKVYKEYGPRAHKTLDLKIGKVEDYVFPKSLDLILAFRVFQHLTKQNSLKVIDNMQENTKRNGHNLFILWESGQKYDEKLGYFTENEITSVYQNVSSGKWDILECERKKHKGYHAIFFAAKRNR